MDDKELLENLRFAQEAFAFRPDVAAVQVKVLKDQLAEANEGLNERLNVLNDCIGEKIKLKEQLAEAKAHIKFLTERLDERPEPPEREGI